MRNSRKKRNYLSFVFLEDLCHPLLMSQLLDIIVHRDDKRKTNIVWVFRAYRFFSAYHTICKLRRAHYGNNIRFLMWPVFVGRLPIDRMQLWLTILQVFPIFLYARFQFGHRLLIHGRSYHASLIARSVACSFRWNVAFDPRSPYLQECLILGVFKKHSQLEYTWKTWEAKLAQGSRYTVATSEPMAEMYRRLGSPKAIVIPNNYADCVLPNFCATTKSRSITLVYSGSLGHWNSVDVYVNFAALVLSKDTDIRFQFLVPVGDHRLLNDRLDRLTDVQRRRISIDNASSHDLYKQISFCTVGVQIMERQDPRLGVKVVEYLASGTPVVVSNSVVGAAHVVSTFDVGLVIDYADIDVEGVISFVREVEKNRYRWFYKCQNTAIQHFSPQRVAQLVYEMQYDNG